jgi:dienelactone hydrolase
MIKCFIRGRPAVVALSALIFGSPLCLGVLRAADDNPFDPAAQQSYAGRFRGQEVELRLKADDARWGGSLLLKGKDYTVDAEVKGSSLKGKFTEGEHAWPFTATLAGDSLTFIAGSFTATLARQKLPRLAGKWGSAKVEIKFQASGEQLAGQIRYGGKEFPFAAAEQSGDLEGVFRNGDKRYPFIIANDPRGLIFQTGKFAERIERLPKPGQPYTNSLGMKFVSVAGTEVSFSVWDTRVQDYRAYAAANDGVDNESWKKPGFAQEDTHPVVNVSWYDAKAFCAWLSRKEGKTYRLPTDAEWSMAVGLEDEPGGTPREKSGQIKGVYPWGTDWPPPRGAGNYADAACQKKRWIQTTIAGYEDGYAETSPVGSFDPNQYGLYDMGGNVWQWCEDFYDGSSGARVLRGASWTCHSPDALWSANRGSNMSASWRNDSGFRCVVVGDSSVKATTKEKPTHSQESSAVKVEHLIFPASIEGKEYQLEARIYRPDDSATHPFIVMNHGRAGMHPTLNTNEFKGYADLNRALASRGYTVMMLVRRGYGNSQGPDSELQDTAVECGLEAAKDIQCAVAYLRHQPHVSKDKGLIMGHSQGGWAALAASTVRMEGVRGVVNLAGGTNYRQMGGDGEVTPTVQTNYVAACGEFGKSAVVPMLWIYVENDWNNPPVVARQMCEAFQGSGGKVKLVIKPPYGNNGHFFVSDPDLFMADLLEFFANIGLTN